MNEVPRDTYFSDVVLQMDAKLWGEEYNRHFPPKKVGRTWISGMQMIRLQILLGLTLVKIWRIIYKSIKIRLSMYCKQKAI